MVSYYYRSYLKVLKKDFMLIVIALVLLVPTFFIWAGIPLFIVGSAVSSMTRSPFLINLCVSSSGALIFSLYFIPFNVKVAQDIAITKKHSAYHSFIRIELVWILALATLFQIILSLVTQ